jgi:hypothetical protein
MQDDAMPGALTMTYLDGLNAAKAACHRQREQCLKDRQAARANESLDGLIEKARRRESATGDDTAERLRTLQSEAAKWPWDEGGNRRSD